MADKPPIHFGTSGWRGIIGEEFTFANVELAVAAIARHVRQQDRKTPALVVGYDTRFLSEEFARRSVSVLSDHGIKPLRERESHLAHRDHAGSTPIIAKHDFEDGDDVPGLFVAMGPGIKKGARVMGLSMSVYDIAPTVLHIYRIPAPKQMKGRVLTEIFETQLRKTADNVSEH